MVQAWLAHPLVNRVLLLGDTTHVPAVHGAQPIHVTSFFSGTAMQRLLEAWTEDYLLLVLPGSVEFGQQALERFVHLAEDTGAGCSTVTSASGVRLKRLSTRSSITRRGASATPSISALSSSSPGTLYSVPYAIMGP